MYVAGQASLGAAAHGERPPCSHANANAIHGWMNGWMDSCDDGDGDGDGAVETKGKERYVLFLCRPFGNLR